MNADEPKAAPTARQRAEALKRRLQEPVDIAWLAYFRIAFGAIMVWEVWRYLTGDRFDRYYVDEGFQFTYYGFGWVHALPETLLYGFFAAMAVLGAMVMIGYKYRIAVVAWSLGLAYWFLLDASEYLNHFYLVVLLGFVAAVVPANRILSVDAARDPSIRSDFTPRWTLWLVRFQLGVPYVGGGIAKLNADWLRGEPMRQWLANRADWPFFGTIFDQSWSAWLFSYGGLLLDLFILPLIIWRPTRYYAFWAAVSFHLLNAYMFNIGIFPWLMIHATTVFLAADWPRKLLANFGVRSVATHAMPASAPIDVRRKIVIALVLGLVAWNVVMPLRHFAYPGNPSWTEEGHNFAWHMKLRDKDGEVTILVTDPDAGRTWEEPLRAHLDSGEIEKLSTHPDFMLQFASYLSDFYEDQGVRDVEVRAWANVSLNGRAPQLFVDPTVDLAKEPRDLMPKRWIYPLTQPLYSS